MQTPNRLRELMKEFFLKASLIALSDELESQKKRLDALISETGYDPSQFESEQMPSGSAA